MSVCVCAAESLESLLLHQRELWSNLLCDLPSTHLHTHKRQKNRTRGNKKSESIYMHWMQACFFVFDPSLRGRSVCNWVFHVFLSWPCLNFWITYFQIAVSTSHRIRWNRIEHRNLFLLENINVFFSAAWLMEVEITRWLL